MSTTDVLPPSTKADVSLLVGPPLEYVTSYLNDPERACPGALQHARWLATTYWGPHAAWYIPNHYPGGAINNDAVFARPLRLDKYSEADKLAWLVAHHKDPEKDTFPKAVQLGPHGFPVKGASSVFIGPTASKLLEAGKKECIFVESAPVSEQVSQLLGIPAFGLGGCWNGIKSRGLSQRQLNQGVKDLITHYKITSVSIWFDYDADKKTILKVSQGANQFEAQLHTDFKGLSVRIIRPHLVPGLCDTKSEPAVQLARFTAQGTLPGEAWKKLCETGLASTETIEFWKVENHYKLDSNAIAKVDEAMQPFLIQARAGLTFLQKARPIDPPLDLLEFGRLTRHVKIHCKNAGNQKTASLSVADCIEWSHELQSKYLVTRVIREQGEAEGLILDPNAPEDVVYNSPIPIPTGFRQPDAAACEIGRGLFNKAFDAMLLVNDPLVVEDAFKTAWWAHKNPGQHPGINSGFFGGEGSFKTSWSLAFGFPFGIPKDMLPLHYKLAGVEPDKAFANFGQLPAEKFSHEGSSRSVCNVYDEVTRRPPAIARALKSAATSAAEVREMNKAQRTLGHGQYNVFNGREPPYSVEVNGSNRRERFIKLLGFGDVYEGRVCDAPRLGKLYGLKVKDMSELKKELFAPLGAFIASYPLFLHDWIEERWPDVVNYNPFMPVASDPKFPLAFYDCTEVSKRILYEIPPFPVLFGTTVNELLGLGYPAHTNPPVSAADLRKIPGYTYNASCPQTHLALPSSSDRVQTSIVIHQDHSDLWFDYFNKQNGKGLPERRWHYDQLVQKLVRNQGALGWNADGTEMSANDPSITDTQREILNDCLDAKFNCDLVQIAKDFYVFTGSREDEVF